METCPCGGVGIMSLPPSAVGEPAGKAGRGGRLWGGRPWAAGLDPELPLSRAQAGPGVQTGTHGPTHVSFPPDLPPPWTARNSDGRPRVWSANSPESCPRQVGG